MLLSTVVKYFRLTWYLRKAGLLSAMEFRSSFLIKFFGMIISDGGFVLLWVFFFQRFPEVNGWTFQDSMYLLAVSSTMYGLGSILAPDVLDLADEIAAGNMDTYLVFPQHPLWHAINRNFHVSAYGDFVFGLSLFAFVGLSLADFGVALVVSIIAAGIYYNLAVATSSLTFWYGRVSGAVWAFQESLLAFSMYPTNIYQGTMKIILMTIIPAYFISALPVSLIRSFSWGSLFLLVAVWAVTYVLARIIFNCGLRRYESGNLIGVKG